MQTVKSRCEILRIGGMEKEKIFDALCSRGIDEKTARFASGICGGQLSKAVAVAEDKKFIDTARFAVDFFARLKNTKKTPPFIAELNRRKDSALLFYEMAELIMRDAAAISCGLETALPDEFKEQLEVIAADYSPEAAASAVGHIEYAKRRTDSGGNFAVVADELVLKILEDKLQMPEIIGVKFRTVGKVYYFAPNDIAFEVGDGAIVETARGLDTATFVTANKEVPQSEIVGTLKPVVRKANAKDKEKHLKNEKRKAECMVKAREKIEERKLDMKLKDVEFTFDGSKIIFYFSSESRVDFRELVRTLRLFSTRE